MARSAPRIALALALALSVLALASATCPDSPALCKSCQTYAAPGFANECERVSNQLQADCLSYKKYPYITGNTPSNVVGLPSDVLGKDSRYLCRLVQSQVQVDCLNLAYGDDGNGQTEYICLLCRSQLCFTCLKSWNEYSAADRAANNYVPLEAKTAGMCQKIQSELQLTCLKDHLIPTWKKAAGKCLTVQTDQDVAKLRS